jgi:hypothetical protein
MVQGLLITVDVLKGSIVGWECDVILLNALCKERVGKNVISGTEYTFPDFI